MARRSASFERPLTWWLRACAVVGLTLYLLSATTPGSLAQAPAVPEAAAPAPPAAPTIPPEHASPRAVLRTFLERVARDEKKEAAKLIDFSGLPDYAIESKAEASAFRLFKVMQGLAVMRPGHKWPPLDDPSAFDTIPESPESGVWSIRELARYPTEDAERIEIVRGENGWWRFSSGSVLAAEELFVDATSAEPKADAAADIQTTVPWSVRYENLFPAFMRRTYFLLPLYQWLSLLLLAGAGRLVDQGGRRLLTVVADALLRRYDVDFKESSASVWRPVGRLGNAATWYAGAAYLIDLPTPVVGVLLVLLRIVTVVSAAWAAFAVISLLADYFGRRAKRSARKFDDLVVPVAATTARVVVVLGTIVLTAAAFSEEIPSTLLGGLGIGGIAIALASQETLSNFFGSITVLFDRPFEVGDWVLVDGVEGEVESVGFRSTRIRTGLNSQVTLPNNKLATAAIDNWGRRRYRRYLTKLGVEYHTTPEQMEAFCEGIRELIRRQPHTRKDFYAAYFNDFGDSALEIMLVVYFEAPDWPTELRERHRLLTDILRLAEKLGVGFAFPTQTIHLHRGAPAPETPSLDDPDRCGQLEAAQIAGELLNYQDRPGKVKFTGPTSV